MFMLSSKRAYLTALAAGLLFFTSPAYAAGTHGGGHGSFEFGEPGKASEVSRTIEVTLQDSYFEPESIEVVPGETVRFLVRNEGQLVHEFNIGTPQMHAAHQEEMQMMVEHGVLEATRINHEMMKMDMGNGHTMEHDDPNSLLLEPGKNGEIVWKFAQEMNLEFACNVPGHYDVGMAGSFNFVKKSASR
jgi:uncharacterized cupredoxin-like copper-binding protein